MQPPVQSLADVNNELARAVIVEHERGYFHTSSLVADALDRNPRVRGALDSRVRAILGTAQYLEPPAEVEGDPFAEDLCAELESWWYTTATEAVLEGLLRYHTTLGFAPAEVSWRVERNAAGSAVWRPAINPWHPAWSNYDLWLRAFYVYTLQGQRLWVQPGNGRWLLLRATAMRPWMRGVVRCIGLEDQLRAQAVRDWARWSEKHGIPITKAYVPQDEVNTEIARAFLRGLRTMGRQGHIKLVRGEDGKPRYDVAFEEMKAAGWEGFERIIGLCDVDVSIAILGQNLTSEVKGGSYAAARVHDEVKLDIVKADAEMLSTCLREDVIKPWVRYNYGSQFERFAPWPRWHVEPPANLEAEGKMFASLMSGIEAAARARAAGVDVPLDVRALFEKFGVPTTAEPEAQQAQVIDLTKRIASKQRAARQLAAWRASRGIAEVRCG